jgi:hypothetical protein
MKLSPIIIGAGGVASYLLFPLNKTFEIEDGILMDADLFEDKNLDRQMFPKSAIGKHKAVVLAKHNKIKLLPVTQYLDSATAGTIAPLAKELKNQPVVICLVDNHPARRAAIQLANDIEAPIIIGANEYETSQAIYDNVDWWSEKYRPTNRYPDMATSNSGSPINCTGEATMSTPQLAMANMVTASLVLNLLWKWHGENSYDPVAPQPYQPIELQTTLGSLETITYGQVQ